MKFPHTFSLPEGPYPPDGPDWVDIEEVSRATAHNVALTEELYVHRVADIRRQLLGLLGMHGAVKAGFGWAVFDDERPGSTAELGAREILLSSGYNAAKIASTGDTTLPTPTLRIVTNESYRTESTIDYLTEEMTIAPDGYANYFATAVCLKENDADQRKSALKQSTAPLFIVNDGKLCFTNNSLPATPYVRVSDPAVEGSTHPFGVRDNLVDNLYALDKVAEILSSMCDMLPRDQHHA